MPVFHDNSQVKLHRGPWQKLLQNGQEEQLWLPRRKLKTLPLKPKRNNMSDIRGTILAEKLLLSPPIVQISIGGERGEGDFVLGQHLQKA